MDTVKVKIPLDLSIKSCKQLNNRQVNKGDCVRFDEAKKIFLFVIT